MNSFVSICSTRVVSGEIVAGTEIPGGGGGWVGVGGGGGREVSISKLVFFLRPVNHSRIYPCEVEGKGGGTIPNTTTRMIYALRWAAMKAIITPSLPQPVQFPGSKVHTYTLANSICDGPVTNLLSILCILIEILSCAHARGMGGGGEALLISSLALLLVIFRATVR